MDQVNAGELVGFLENRWLEVVVVPGLHGDGGYDVVLRLDGTYADGESAVAVAGSFVEQLRATGLHVRLGLEK